MPLTGVEHLTGSATGVLLTGSAYECYECGCAADRECYVVAAAALQNERLVKAFILFRYKTRNGF